MKFETNWTLLARNVGCCNWDRFGCREFVPTGRENRLQNGDLTNARPRQIRQISSGWPLMKRQRQVWQLDIELGSLSRLNSPLAGKFLTQRPLFRRQFCTVNVNDTQTAVIWPRQKSMTTVPRNNRLFQSPGLTRLEAPNLNKRNFHF